MRYLRSEISWFHGTLSTSTMENKCLVALYNLYIRFHTILLCPFRKKAKSQKEKAKKDHEKSHKQYQKRQSKAEILAEKELKKLAKEWDQGYNEDVSTMPHRPSTVLMALKQKMTRSTSQGKSVIKKNIAQWLAEPMADRANFLSCVHGPDALVVGLQQHERDARLG